MRLCRVDAVEHGAGDALLVAGDELVGAGALTIPYTGEVLHHLFWFDRRAVIQQGILPRRGRRDRATGYIGHHNANQYVLSSPQTVGKKPNIGRTFSHAAH